MAGFLHGTRNSSLAGAVLMNSHQQLLMQDEELQFQQGVLQVQDPAAEEEEEIDVVGDGAGGKLVPKMPPLMPASIWTNKDVRVFKDSVKKNTPECVIRIGSLATATVSATRGE